jgi:hypothetical protein
MLVLVNGLYCHAIVFRSVGPWNVFLGISCGQVEMRDSILRRQCHAPLKMSDCFIVLSLPKGLGTQIQFVACCGLR